MTAPVPWQTPITSSVKSLDLSPALRLLTFPPSWDPHPPTQGPSSPIALCYPPPMCHCHDTRAAVLLMRLSAPRSQGCGPPGH